MGKRRESGKEEVMAFSVEQLVTGGFSEQEAKDLVTSFETEKEAKVKIWGSKYPQVMLDTVTFDPRRGTMGEWLAKCKCPKCKAISTLRGAGDFQWYGEAHTSKHGCADCKVKGAKVGGGLRLSPEKRERLAAFLNK